MLCKHWFMVLDVSIKLWIRLKYSTARLSPQPSLTLISFSSKFGPTAITPYDGVWTNCLNANSTYFDSHKSKNRQIEGSLAFLLNWWSRSHLHLHRDHSCGSPSHGECKKITMPPPHGTLDHPTKFSRSLGRSAHRGTGKLRWRIQAGDKLHGRHWYPRDHHTLCPMSHCGKLQHGHSNNHHRPDEG